MPTIAYRSRIRAGSDDHVLTLHETHRMIARDSSDTTYTLNKARFPDDVDVLLASNLDLILSGVLDRVRVPLDVLAASQLAQHLVEYFRTVNNASLDEIYLTASA